MHEDSVEVTIHSYHLVFGNKYLIRAIRQGLKPMLDDTAV